MIIYYSVPTHCEESRYELELPDPYCLARPLEQSEIAELCADDYWSSHDGWEASWPLDFALFESEDGPEIARCLVDMEAVPQFHASRPKPKEEVKRNEEDGPQEEEARPEEG